MCVKETATAEKEFPSTQLTYLAGAVVTWCTGAYSFHKEKNKSSYRHHLPQLQSNPQREMLPIALLLKDFSF